MEDRLIKDEPIEDRLIKEGSMEDNLGEDKLVLSPLGHTWILDLDGTIVKHNGYKIDGQDTFLDGAEAFLKSLPTQDRILFLTSREEKWKEPTERFLREHGIRFDCILYNMPYGERILLNDCKPSGLKMGYAVNRERDNFRNLEVIIDEGL